MLISHRNKFIYTKTAKTAGTSVESYFETYCMPEGKWKFAGSRETYISESGIIGCRGNGCEKNKDWYNHMPALDIRNKIGISIWDDYFKFCVVRNPFDKLISAFFFFEKDKGEGRHLINNFRKWVKRGKKLIDRNKYIIGDEICVDYFIRYEELMDGIKHVSYLLNIPYEAQKIPKLKSGCRDTKIPLRDFYDEETIEIVKYRFKFELQYFNYSLPG